MISRLNKIQLIFSLCIILSTFFMPTVRNQELKCLNIKFKSYLVNDVNY